jgi:SWI/SNF-related matrix-associated actin-dependent regulator 1 of chromatin subfamily A
MPATVSGSTISLRFSYKPAVVAAVKDIPGRSWDDKQRVWTLPATPWHARQVIDKLSNHITVELDVKKLALKDKLDLLHADDDLIEELSVEGFAPYPYQAAVVPVLDLWKGRALIADEVGVGKTPESLVWARHKKVRRFLVVCPASVLYKWEREIQRWYPEVTPQVIPTGKTPLTGSVQIISYALMTNRVTELTRQKYDLIIFDEVHAIRNFKTARAKAAKLLAKGVPYLLGLSGTPIVNRPIELFNFLNMLDPKAWTWQSYAKRYCFNEYVGYKAAENLDELEERLRGVMIRRFKRDVSDQMPAFTRTVVPFDLIDAERKVYKKLWVEDPATFAQIFPMTEGVCKNTAVWLGYMRQWFEGVRALHVAEWAEDFLQGSDTRKLVIYCDYKRTARLLEDMLYTYGVLKITGDVAQKDRQPIIDRWQNELSERVMILTAAGGEGIDLFGRGEIDSSTIVFAGRAWSPAAEEQIEGRVDRTGQQYPVEAVYLVARDTIDEDINDLIEGKRSVIKQAVRLFDKQVEEGNLYSILERKGKQIRL